MVDTALLILANLLKSDPYCKKVIPYMESKWFELGEDRRISQVIKDFYIQYQKIPSKTVLFVHFKEKVNLSNDEYEIICNRINAAYCIQNEEFSEEHIIKETENYFQEHALQLAIIESADIYEDKDRRKEKNSIPGLIEEALKVSLNSSVGHDYFDDVNYAINHYKSKTLRYPTHLENLNKSIGGGFARKTLNIIIGQMGAGKSRLLCDLGVHYYKQGLNVLYITLELAEMEIRSRFDANILDVDINSLSQIENDVFINKINALKAKNWGKVVVKEYPTGSASVIHFKHLLSELKMKKSFKPDVIIIDYLAIAAPAKNFTNMNSFSYVKEIATEVRGLASEYDAIVLTANQINRPNMQKSDVDITCLAESVGVGFVADFMVAMTTTDDLLDQQKLVMKVLKNRLYSLGKDRKFKIGFDDSRMRCFDVDFNDVSDDFPVENTKINKFNKGFEGFKFE